MRALAVPHLAVLLGASLITASPPSVHVPGVGTLNGEFSRASKAVALFRGIPFALPPVKDLRWRPPQPYNKSLGVFDANKFGNACFTFEENEANQSEDCLFLNVAAPSEALGMSKLPVMVYIHGGAYTSGDAKHSPIDSMVARSQQSVVVVSINYRLNVFGFLGSSSLKGRSLVDPEAFGNYGIEDQRLALAWVHDHIAAFGGDGNDLTIFGESAGGNSVIQHLTQTQSFGLYSKAIVESGAYMGSISIPDAEERFKSILNASKCEHLTCLLQVSGQALANATRQLWRLNPIAFTFGPVIDGTTLTAHPQQLIGNGKYNNRVPVMIGSNRDEASFFMVRDKMFPDNLTEVQLNQELPGLFPMLNASGIAVAKQIYSPTNYEYPSNLGRWSQSWWTAMRMATDGATGLGPCTVRRLARMMVSGNSPAVFAYIFNHPSQEVVTDLNEGTPVFGTSIGSTVVPHASELPYVFGRLEGLSAKNGEANLSLSMSAYWNRFAHEGDPNSPSLPTWPPYDNKQDAILGLDVETSGIKIERKTRAAACDFWEAHMMWPRFDSQRTIQLLV